MNLTLSSSLLILKHLIQGSPGDTPGEPALVQAAESAFRMLTSEAPRGTLHHGENISHHVS